MAFATLNSLSITLERFYVLKITQSEWDELNSLRRTLQQLDYSIYRGIDRSEINELEAKITEAAWEVEDVIESYQISQGGIDEEVVEQEIHSFFQTLEKLRREYARALDHISRVAVADEDEDGSIHDAANSTTVGLSDLSEEIISVILDDESECNVYAIWGMAGIGKSHLARDIYHHPLIVQHFDLRLWMTIGPNYKRTEDIYVDMLAQIQRKPRDLFKEKDSMEVMNLLWISLLNRRYLIVLDDIWSLDVLSDCINAIPYNQNKRNILTTTRLRDAVEYWAGHKIWQLPFLKDEESWTLLSRNVFGEKPFPTQLEKPGKKIAELCEGLPLLILAVADILRGLDRTEECWNKVAEKKTTTFPDAYDRIYEVLVSSYDYLPQVYKACFLYMGVFRQSYEILVSKLIHLWMVEGFGFLDETMEMLVSSSLAIVCKRSSKSGVKSCKLHSVYWYVCITEARKIKLFHVLIKLIDVFIESPRRLSVQNNMLFGLKEVYDSMAAATSLTRSLVFSGEDHQYPVQICFNKMLLMKVLDALAIRFYEFPNEVLNLSQLKYLSLTHNGEVPPSISKLQRLRFLILRRHHNIINAVQSRESTTYLPKEIWDLQELWYLRITGSKLPDPTASRGEELPNLSRLYLNADSCTMHVLRGTPALTKLRIEIELQPEGGVENSLRCLEHTWVLHRLKSLTCVVVNPRLSSQVDAPPNHLSNLPRSLEKLSLKGLGYPWNYMSALYSLPFLRVLKLRCSAFRGADWEIREWFSLAYLLLEDMDVIHWTTERNLLFVNHLIIRHCYKLKRTPDCSQYVKMIEVDECSSSAVKFAQQIDDNDNPSRPNVVINVSWNL